MKNITIIGDSHAETVNSAWDDLTRLQRSQVKTKSIIYSGVSAYNIDYSNLDKSEIEDSTILLVFGECDIRRHLPKFNNAQEVVQKYVHNSLEYFKGFDVIFMQPIPQAIDELTHEFNHNIQAWHSFEKRMEQQKIFYDSLMNSDQKVISMFDAIGQEFLTSDHTDDGCHLNRDIATTLVEYINIAVD